MVRMIGVVLVTHGSVGKSLLEAAAWIAGSALEHVVNVPMNPDHSPDDQAKRISDAVAGFEDGAVILTDLFGGTPQNLALTLLDEGRVDVVSGVNLPMLLGITAARAQSHDVHELAVMLHRRGQNAMVVAGDTLRRHAEASRELPAVSS
jgi:PTS system mannose-specific IIA component